MPAKKPAAKPDETAAERIVDVTFARTKNGVNKNDIFKAALAGVRDEVPLVSNLSYELVSNEVISDTERKAKVKISWAPHTEEPSETDPEDGDFVGQHLEALTVPTTLPAGVEAEPGA